MSKKAGEEDENPLLREEEPNGSLQDGGENEGEEEKAMRGPQVFIQITMKGWPLLALGVSINDVIKNFGLFDPLAPSPQPPLLCLLFHESMTLLPMQASYLEAPLVFHTLFVDDAKRRSYNFHHFFQTP